MNSESIRDFLAQVIIVGAVCAGLPLLALAPMKESAAVAQAELAAARTEATETYTSPQEIPKKLRNRVDWISNMSAVSGDPSEVYNRIAKLASTNDVRVDRITPSRSGAGRLREVGMNAPLRHTIDAIGAFADVARFINALESDTGFCAIDSMRISPLQGQGEHQVRATVQVLHYAFDPYVVEVVANAEEDDQ